jgi:hypothetical protein
MKVYYAAGHIWSRINIHMNVLLEEVGYFTAMPKFRLRISKPSLLFNAQGTALGRLKSSKPFSQREYRKGINKGMHTEIEFSIVQVKHILSSHSISQQLRAYIDIESVISPKWHMAIKN